MCKLPDSNNYFFLLLLFFCWSFVKQFVLNKIKVVLTINISQIYLDWHPYLIALISHIISSLLLRSDFGFVLVKQSTSSSANMKRVCINQFILSNDMEGPWQFLHDKFEQDRWKWVSLLQALTTPKLRRRLIFHYHMVYQLFLNQRPWRGLLLIHALFPVWHFLNPQIISSASMKP